MTHADLIEHRAIRGKDIYIFESHHFALFPWARLSCVLGAPARLLTLDFHTDTLLAFTRYACNSLGGALKCTMEDWMPVAEQEVARIDAASDGSIEIAVSRLKFDEHINAALRANILDLAFVIANQVSKPIRSNEQIQLDESLAEMDPIQRLMAGRQGAQPPFTYAIPLDRTIILPKRYDYPWINEESGEGAYNDAALESEFLRERLGLIAEICSTGNVPHLFEQPFILDIDLDYFNTLRSITPDDPDVFYDLIRRASIITIARESDCVLQCRIDGQTFTSQDLEAALLEHIDRALGSDHDGGV
jgi:hypothetical protein